RRSRTTTIHPDHYREGIPFHRSGRRGRKARRSGRPNPATRGGNARASAIEAALSPQSSLLLGVGLVGFLVAAGLYFSGGFRPRPQPSGERLMLAVLPFQNLTGDAGQEYFTDGMTEEMITQLGNLDPQHLGVIARTSVMHYKNSSTPLEQIDREL